MAWYAGNTTYQGLVYDEKDGKNIAVVYDKANTALIAAAPEMYEACEETGLASDDAIAGTLEQMADKECREGLRLMARELRARTSNRRAAIAKAEDR
jgi:hypothetical protein